MKKDKSKIIYKSHEYIYDLQSKRKKKISSGSSAWPALAVARCHLSEPGRQEWTWGAAALQV